MKIHVCIIFRDMGMQSYLSDFSLFLVISADFRVGPIF